MGFILRAVFWLALAMVLIPPQNRLGGDDTADFRDVDVGLELHNAAYAAWTFGVKAMQTCDTNPELCKAGQDLLDTTLKTGANLATEVQNQWQKAADKPRQLAHNEPRPPKKIQARVE